jgi:hypothetical protein
MPCSAATFSRTCSFSSLVPCMASLHVPSIPLRRPAPAAASHGCPIVSIQFYQRRSDYPGPGEVCSSAAIAFLVEFRRRLIADPLNASGELGQVLPYFAVDAIAIGNALPPSHEIEIVRRLWAKRLAWLSASKRCRLCERYHRLRGRPLFRDHSIRSLS